MLAAHRSWLSNVVYMPMLPWKKGERDAFKSAGRLINDVTAPIFVIPPAGDFDHEVGYIPTPAQHVLSFGPRLFEARRQRPVFVDAKYLDDARHRIDPKTHPLFALLERARLAGAQAWPLTALGRSDEYQEAVARFHLKNDVPVAMEIALADLGSPELARKLTSLCNQVSCDPTDAVLIVNTGPLHVNEAEEVFFVDLVIQTLNELPMLYSWNQIVFSATSLSDPIKLVPGQQKSIRRIEWHVRNLLVIRQSELYRLPIFSDYGVEYTKDLRPKRARPTARVSYTRDGDHFYAKGQSVKHAGYEAIYPVADIVAGCDGFKGEAFSLGDARIVAWHHRKASTGNAPIWRWAAVDHHLAMVVPPLAAQKGIELEVPALPPAEQTEMFPAK
jgi:hypothetical protein